MAIDADEILMRLEALLSRWEEQRERGCAHCPCREESRRREMDRDKTLDAVLKAVDGLHELLALGGRSRLTVSQAARYARVESATLRRWLADGRLKGAKIGSRRQSRWVIGKSDLERFLNRNVNHAPTGKNTNRTENTRGTRCDSS